jgi:protein O-mannosyl-transferase
MARRSADGGITCLRDAAAWASLFCVTLLAYFPSLHGSLLWDDSSHVTSPQLQSWHGLWRIWFDVGATQQYYPLLHSAFWIEHRMWGDAVLGYHLTNVVLHAAAACLVVMIARRLSLPGAWLAGFVFALHPICVESVAWISEQKNTLSAVFCLGAALAYLGFDETRRRSRYLLALALFVLALLSKTVTATLPAALVVVCWWRRGRLEWKRDVLPLAPWFGLGLCAGLLTTWLERVSIGAQGGDFALTPVERFLLAGRAIWFYADKVVWPAHLVFQYPRWKIDGGVWWQYLFPAGALVVAIGLWLAARRRRGPLAAFMVFTATLAPVLGFLDVYPFIYSYVADHFQYLASLGIIVPGASALAAAARRIPLGKAGGGALAALLLLVLGVSTWRQNGMYRDAEVLYRETLASNPDSWLAHNNLGNVLFQTPGRLPETMAEYDAALRLKPDLAQAHYNLGNILSRIPGRLPEAIAEYQAALRSRPGLAEVHANLGNALSRVPGRLGEAVAEYQAALRIDPDLPEAHYNLGNVLYLAGQVPEAVVEYRAALSRKPDYADAHYNLGNILSQVLGRQPEAVVEYRAALRTEPDRADIHANLGSALMRMPGGLPEAIAEYEAALRIDPDLAIVHYNLGRALSRIPGRMADAAAEYRAALRIRPDLPVPQAARP